MDLLDELLIKFLWYRVLIWLVYKPNIDILVCGLYFNIY